MKAKHNHFAHQVLIQMDTITASLHQFQLSVHQDMKVMDWKLYPRYSINKLWRWIGNRRIRWMYSIDNRFTINHRIFKMPRQSYFRRKRRMYPKISFILSIIRSWFLEWRKWKLHLSYSTSGHYPIIISKCLLMSRCNWWIIIRNLSFARCYCSKTNLTLRIISTFRRASFLRLRYLSQSKNPCKETSST